MAKTAPQGKRTGSIDNTVPLRISYHLWEDYEERVARLRLIRVGEVPLALTRFWPAGLTTDAAAFLAEHCHCAFCERPIQEPIGPCSCRKPRRGGYLLEVLYRGLASAEAFNKIYAREDSRAKARARGARIAANGGKADPKLFPEMLEAQESRCYYCAASLLDEHGKAVIHADHYEPLHLGGSNGFDNNVLACASCNKRKGKLWPTTFKQKIARERGPEGTIVVRRIWRQLDRWRATKKAGT